MLHFKSFLRLNKKHCINKHNKNQCLHLYKLLAGQNGHPIYFIPFSLNYLPILRAFAQPQAPRTLIFQITHSPDYNNNFFQQWENLKYGQLKYQIPQYKEDEILVKVSNTIKSKKWKKASQELRKCGFQRSDVECRQRYINHLDPSVNKELWSEQELQILYTKYDQYGNKWFLLQKHLPGRTQTKIKNYFYGTIRYFLKIIIKYFCKKSTGFVNDIKTQTLLDMYEAKGNFEGCSIIHITIKKLKFKVQKSACERLIRQNEEIFYNFTQRFLTNQSQKTGQQQNSSYDDSKDPTSLDVVKIQCQPVQPTKVEVISSTGGDIDHKTSQLEHLRAMAMNHFKWYEYYQNAYLALFQKKQQNYL